MLCNIILQKCIINLRRYTFYQTCNVLIEKFINVKNKKLDNKKLVLRLTIENYS